MGPGVGRAPKTMARNVAQLTGCAWLVAGLALGARASRGFADDAPFASAGDILGSALSVAGGALGGLLVSALLWRFARRRARTLATMALSLRGVLRALARPTLLAPLALALTAAPGMPWPGALAALLTQLAWFACVPALGLALAFLLPRRAAPEPAGAKEPDARATAPIGVLLLDAEEPEAPRARSVRRHLQRVLGDRLSQPRRSLASALWRRYAVAPWRARKLAREYRRVWTSEGGPRARADFLVARALTASLGPAWRVAVAGPRDGGGLREAVEGLLAAGCEEIRVLPLLPQYSVAASGARLAELHRLLARRRLQPALRIETHLYRHAGLLDAWVEHARGHGLGTHGEPVVFAFPDRPPVLEVDPYADQCRATAAALARRLGLAAGDWHLGFGDGEAPGGGEPNLHAVVVALAAKCPRVSVLPAGVTTDGIETLHGLAVELAAEFQRAGGRELRVAPALNDHPRWIRALAELARGGTPAVVGAQGEPPLPHAELLATVAHRADPRT